MPLQRRTFLAGMGALAFASAAKGPSARLEVRLNQKIGRISPLIYGHFAEHIGRLIYGGVWVGPDSPIPNQAGLRLDTLEALVRVKPSVIRWPGGCFAD